MNRFVRLLLACCLTLGIALVFSSRSRADNAIDTLADRIGTGELDQVRAITRELTATRSPEAYAKLRLKLADQPPAVRREILEGLKNQAPAELFDAILVLVLDGDSGEEKSLARDVLMNIDNTRLPELLAGKSIDSLTVAEAREECLEILGTLSSVHRAADVGILLLPLFSEPATSDRMKSLAAAALVNLTGQNFGQDAAAWRKYLLEARKYSDPTVLLTQRIQQLEERLAAGDRNFQALLQEHARLKVDYLNLRKDPELYVAELRVDQYRDVLVAVLEQVGKQKINTEASQRAILALLQHKDASVLEAAIGLAGQFQIKAAIDPLFAMIDSAAMPPTTRGAALLAAGQIVPEAIVHWDRIRKIMAGTENPADLRQRAARAMTQLAQAGSGPEHDAILRALRDTFDAERGTENDIRLEIVHALSGFAAADASFAQEILHEALTGARATIRQEAVLQIRAGRLAAFKEPLLNLLKDPDEKVRREARVTLQAVHDTALLRDAALYEKLTHGADAAQTAEITTLLTDLARKYFTRDTFAAESLAEEIERFSDVLFHFISTLRLETGGGIRSVMSALGAQRFQEIYTHVNNLNPQEAAKLSELYLLHLTVLFEKAGAAAEEVNLCEFLETQLPNSLQLKKKIAFARMHAGQYDDAIPLLTRLPSELAVDASGRAWWEIQYAVALALHCTGRFTASNEHLTGLTADPAQRPHIDFADLITELRDENTRMADIQPDALAAEKNQWRVLAEGSDAEKAEAKRMLSEREQLPALIDGLRHADSEVQFIAVRRALEDLAQRKISVLWTAPLADKVECILQLRQQLLR